MFTNISGGTLAFAKYTQIGKTVVLKWKYTLAGAGVGTAPTFSLPVTAVALTAGEPVLSQIQLNDITGNRYGGQVIYSSTTAFGFFSTSAATTGAFAGVTSTAPFTWASGDIINVTACYEAA